MARRRRVARARKPASITGSGAYYQVLRSMTQDPDVMAAVERAQKAEREAEKAASKAGAGT